MQREQMTPSLRTIAIYSMCAVAVVAALTLIPFVRAADQPIDLDQNAANGAESRVSTKVLQTYPVVIENTIFNNAGGGSYDFSWPGAGPGGFASFLTAGPGVGTVWRWSTVYQVYSIESPVTFKPAKSLPVFGSPTGGVQTVGGSTTSSFMVPGKSINPTSVTLSSTSLTSSLITFFSPKQTVATCGVECAPGQCEVSLSNQSGGTVMIATEQLDCCPEPHQTFCDGDCTSYLTDPENCGGCGNVCGTGELCSDGACVCPSGQAQCGSGCIDILSDPGNCGGCGVTCDSDQYCDGGTCQDICPGETLCGTQCVDTTMDKANCGGCGIRCEPNDICTGGLCMGCRGALQTSCNNQCVDIYSDTDNCGGCGNVCGSGEVCSSGACVPGLTSGGRGTASLSGTNILSPRGAATQRTAPAARTSPAAASARDRRGGRMRPISSTADSSGGQSTQTVTAQSPLTVVEAPVCDLQPIQEMVPPGGTYTQTQTGGRFGREIQTSVRIESGGQLIAQGPCPLIVPVTGVDTSGVILSPISVVTTDTSGDGLCQPGEARCDYLIKVADLGDTPCMNPLATLSSPPDQFNPNQLIFLNATSTYPTLPAYPGDGVPLDAKTNATAFGITSTSDQPSDVGRPFLMDVSCTNVPGSVQMPLTLGIGTVCDPATDLDAIDVRPSRRIPASRQGQARCRGSPGELLEREIQLRLDDSIQAHPGLRRPDAQRRADQPEPGDRRTGARDPRPAVAAGDQRRQQCEPGQPVLQLRLVGV